MKALSFSLNQLFIPNFGPELSINILNSLKEKTDLGLFDRFTETTLSGIPLDPETFEIFDIHNYLPEIQFAFDLAPAVEFAAPNFQAADLFDALFPTSIPTVKSFGAFVKKEIMSKIRLALDGLFDAKVNVPTVGLSVDDVTFGVDGINIGVYTEHNNRLFPPMVDIDVIQVRCLHAYPFNFILKAVSHICFFLYHHKCSLKEFDFDLNVDTVDGSLVIDAKFMLNAEGINPLQTLSDISSALNGLLADSEGQFESIASSFGTTFESAAELFSGIAEDDRITLLMNAKLDVATRLELSFEAVSFTARINEASMALLAKITDTFDLAIGSFGDIHITPSVQLRLHVENTATPFNMIENPSALGQVSFSGDLEGIINVGMDNVPAEVSLRVFSPNLMSIDNLEFEARLDIDLVPIQGSEFDSILCVDSIPSSSNSNWHLTHPLSGINTILDEIAALSYPIWLADAVPFLPALDFSCVSTNGKYFLEEAIADSSPATVSGFLDAISAGCRHEAFSLYLSGGYDNGELEINILLETSASGSL